MNQARTVYSLCGMCGARCPVEVTLNQAGAPQCPGHAQRPRWISGNSHSPSGTAMCPRGAAALAQLDDDKRVLAPHIRQGGRGAGQWREASWDEALDHVAEQLQECFAKHGPQSLLWSERPGPHSDFSKALMRGLGSPNYSTHNVTCQHNVHEASYSLTGRGSQQWVYDYAHCKHLVLQGRNLFEALSTGEVNQVLNALNRQKGEPCRLTVMDVRATITAAKAQRFWLTRPGTDYAMNLAVLHILLRDNLCHPSAAETVQDLDALRHFVRDYTPAFAEAETGIPATALEELVQELASQAPAVIWHPGWMASRYTQSLALSRSAYLINALLGSLGAQGGLVPLPAPDTKIAALEKLYPAVDKPRADGVGWKYKHLSPQASLLPQALASAGSGEAHAVAAYVTLRHDPLVALPDAEELKQRLSRIPFLLCMTPLWSDTAWHSDVVLPLALALESDFPLMVKPGLNPTAYLPRHALEPQGQARPDWWVMSQLAARMGVDKLAFDSVESLWAAQLQGSGLSTDDFQATGFVRLNDGPRYKDLLPLPTPSGKVEVLCARWEDAGIASLQAYKRPAAPPEISAEEGKAQAFRLVVGRTALHTQSNTQNLAPLLEHCAENQAWIHPERAQQLSVADGELVLLDGARPLHIRVRVTPDIHPEALFMTHGFGHKLPMERRAYGKGVADQELMTKGLDLCDKAGLVPALQEHFVVVRKILREFA